MKIQYKEFEKALKKTIEESEEKKNFGCIGVFGSKNTENDIDLLITPNKEARKGEFMIHINKFLKSLENNLPKGSRLIVTPLSTLNEEINYISKRTTKDILLHIASFPALLLKDEQLKKGISSTLKVYYGDKKSIRCQKKSNFQSYYDYLWAHNCFYSKYPKELRKRKIQKLAKYIIEHLDTSEKDIYELLCKLLDKTESEIKKPSH